MRRLRYLVTIDESFAVKDYSRASRFLRDVFGAVPAADVGFVVRLTSLLPMAPAAADGMLVSPVAPTIVSKYHHLMTEDIAESAGQRAKGWGQSSGMLTFFDDTWDRIRHALDHSSLKRAAETLDLEGLTNKVRAYDAVVHVQPDWEKSVPPTGKAQFICQLASRTDLPIWLCPLRYDGIYRVVIAVTGRAGEDRLLSVGQSVADAFGVPLAIICSGTSAFCSAFNHHSKSKTSCLPWPIRTCRRVEEIPACLESDELLVMGAYGRWPFTRIFCKSNTERILGRLRNPALIFPHRRSSWTFGVTNQSQSALFQSPELTIPIVAD